jgi:hypothetical protein
MQSWERKRIDDEFFKVMQSINRQTKTNKEEVKFKYKDGELYKFAFDWIDDECCGIELFKAIEIEDEVLVENKIEENKEPEKEIA